jgi:hypothetical protein
MNAKLGLLVLALATQRSGDGDALRSSLIGETEDRR